MARLALRIALLAAVVVACAALDRPSGAPKQTPGTYLKQFLKPSKSEDAIDAGFMTIPGKAAWALKTTSYFGLWYFFNIFYNVANKKALNALNLPWLQSLVCVAVGIPYILATWQFGIREKPRLSSQQMKELLPIVSLHAAGNVGGNVAFGSGALGFAHVLKSMEPAFTAVFSGLLTGKWQHPFVYATLIPVMGGVAYASASELNFNMLQFVAAMVSNVGFSLRAVIGKQIMSSDAWDRKVTKLDGPNTFGVLQIGSTLVTIPFVIALEGWKALFPSMHPNWKNAIGKLDHAGAMITPGYLWNNLIMSGMAFQLYYEAAFLALDAVSPITHSIGNNIKRIVIVITSVIIFGQKMSTKGMIGSGIALGGVFIYSLVTDYFAKKAKGASK
eukprot:CAMPEP_0174950930 /NCGR_PEP_ID=MMETSP1355-20121228/94586_1 /TAXON_ID=464990 /ORGANISM="Hemiselmis tepida, Strain CCMP443" /LENGTH=387 /DNA_ID=CAMNT_0016198567 /DNA_START=19 /DNA_END=1182 /DNA_ORIENTATION=-